MSEERADGEAAAEESALLSDDLNPSLVIKRQKTKRMIVVALILAAVGVGGFFLWKALTTVDRVPHKVIVAISVTTSDGTVHAWWADGAEISELWSQKVMGRLEGLDMLPLTINSDLEAAFADVSDAASMQDACAALGASYVVVGDLKTVNTAPLASQDAKDFVYEFDVDLLDCDDARGTVDVLASPVRYMGRGTDELTAAESITYGDPTDLFIGPLASALVERPGMVALKEGGAALPLEHAEIFNELEKTLFLAASDYKKRMEDRGRSIEDAKVYATGLEASQLDRRMLGEFIAQEDVVGAVADGVLILAETVQNGFTWPPGEIVINTTIEQLIRADESGGSREIVFEHDNIYSFPSVSLDGRFAAFVQSNQRGAKSLAILDLESGDYTSVLAHADHYFSTPQANVGGTHIAYIFHRSRRGDRSIELVEVESRDRVEVVGAEDWWSTPRWNQAGDKLYLSIKRVGEEYASVYAYDVASAELQPLLGPALTPDVRAEEPAADDGGGDGSEGESGGDGLGLDAGPETSPGGAFGDGEVLDEIPAPTPISSYTRIAPSPTGDFAMVFEDDGEGSTHLGRLELETGAYERIVQFPVGHMVISPDGKWVAVQTDEWSDDEDPGSYDEEIVLIPTSGDGAPVPVTLNDVDDYLREWSLDSAAVYATQYSNDPDFRRLASRAFRIEVPTAE